MQQAERGNHPIWIGKEREMGKRWKALIGILPLALAVTACGSSADTGTTDSASLEAGTVETDSSAVSDSTAESASDSTETREHDGNSGGGAGGQGNGGTLDKSWDTELSAMLEEAEDSFTQDSYTDDETGLSVSYNIYVPDDYAGDGSAPIVFFIGDATTAGNTMEYSLEQGWGGIVWATDTVQSREPCIVVTLVFPEVVLDDNSGSYEMTDYGKIVPDLITSVTEKYGADPDRIYGTGQSMGAMTTLYTAAQNPDLYSAVLIVDGQWDISTLQGIENVDFIYVTAGGDEKATDGQTEVKEMLSDDGVDYAEISDLDASKIDDSDTKSEIEDAVSAMLDEGSAHKFITWTAGSVLTNYGGSGSEHMASFDYGYKLECVRDWILDH